MKMETLTQLTPSTGWLRRWKVFGMTFAVAKGCGVKAKWPKPKGCSKKRAINGTRLTNAMANAHKKKDKLYERQHGECWLCHKSMDMKKMQIHHILPLVLYPELGATQDNLICLCPECHQHIHCNPLLSSTLIRETAQKMGVTDLSERFGLWLTKKMER